MNANTLQHRRLDFSKLNNRIVGTLSSEEALKDITPMQWSKSIISGKDLPTSRNNYCTSPSFNI